MWQYWRIEEKPYKAVKAAAQFFASAADSQGLLEGLLLLTSLTPTFPDLQKLVAYENVFDRIFSIIDREGSLTHGGIPVQDCLSLLANLLRLNTSNQNLFRETGWIKKLAALLSEALKDQVSHEGVAEWAQSQRDKNVWGLLAVIRLFLVRGGIGTQANQRSFWQNGVLAQVLEYGFLESIDMNIRSEVSLLLIYLTHLSDKSFFLRHS